MPASPEVDPLFDILSDTGGAVIVIGVEAGRRVAGRQGRTRALEASGGVRLRALREAAGKTQLWVEAEAGLGSGYLQRVECGKVAQPERLTLERILAALGTRYGERRDVLERFGYLVATPLPDESEIAWAGAVSRPALSAVAFPAYVLDCAHRLIAWNRFVPRLFGIPPNDPTLSGLARHSLLAPWFDPDSRLASLVVEPDLFLPALIRALRDEMQLFRSEPWYPPLIGRLWRDLPRFRRYWRLVEREPNPVSASRTLSPVRLAVPGAGVLQFRLASEHFTQDLRFRIVYYVPADTAAMQQCADWTAQAADVSAPRHGR
jgi:transcriptional regulator with XRE-family HTH domain